MKSEGQKEIGSCTSTNGDHPPQYDEDDLHRKSFSNHQRGKPSVGDMNGEKHHTEEEQQQQQQQQFTDDNEEDIGIVEDFSNIHHSTSDNGQESIADRVRDEAHPRKRFKSCGTSDTRKDGTSLNDVNSSRSENETVDTKGKITSLEQSPNDEGKVTPGIQNATYITSQNNDGDVTDGKRDDGITEQENHNADNDEAENDANNLHKKNKKSRLDQQGHTFPQRLMDAIDQESQHYMPILDWVETGDAFVIREKVAFEHHVLPKYFSSSNCKFASFVRKLYRQVVPVIDR